MRKILVVDDHSIAREPLARLLSFEGYQTTTAANGAEALSALHQQTPDLVLLDVVMPKMSGILFLESARRDPRWKQLPIILVTGVLDPNEIRRAGALGVCSIMTKARFSVDELLRQIKALFPAELSVPAPV